MKKVRENNSFWNKNIKISRTFNSEKFINILELQRLTLSLVMTKRKSKLKNGKRSWDTLSISLKIWSTFLCSQHQNHLKKKLLNSRRKSWLTLNNKTARELQDWTFINHKMRLQSKKERKVNNKARKPKVRNNQSSH